MWYAASEIVFFLVLAAFIGGLIGYGIAQIYQIDFGAIRAASNTRKDDSEELAMARVEIADLRRKLDMATEALRGDTPAPELQPPLIAPSSAEDAPSGETVFPPGPSAGHDVEGDATDGRRLSERVADAERS